ncbi:hypothetical protein SELMODRAFT_430009 [Selaginella moellendorffii]|uniref:PHD-type domain-containing protein n=1 Tax=Selaginella moellendorffii TaxID=88036 RepID=D8T813_SELML|nr:hypothetical protein SELMODRAFT_430009 [Selaginella moellendorffii]
MGKRPFVLVYQSGNYVWSFDSNGGVELTPKSQFQATSLRPAKWHLINQKIEPSDALGKRVLVAASPDPANVKNAYPDRQLARVYLYPCEFDALVKLWEEEASQLEKRASQLEMQQSCELQGCSLEETDTMMEDELKNTYEVQEREGDDANDKVIAGNLRDEAGLIRIRVGVADTYYKWFGGVPRKLWQLEPRLLTDIELERFVDTALFKTDVGKVYRAIAAGAESDDISWMLLHLKRPQAAGYKYLIDFASSKIKYKFTSSIPTANRHDLIVLLDSRDPGLGALGGFLFEQDVVAKVLQSPISAVLMVDDKHCTKCNSRMDCGEGPVNWIACGVCKKWYHYLCVLETAPVPLKWRCASCEGKPGDEVLTTTRRLRLRYFRGDLKEALSNAGADAVNYVWRPLRKKNGSYDFAILPGTLGQATTAKYHPVPFEAIKGGLAALEAWNKEYNKEDYPERLRLPELSEQAAPRIKQGSERYLSIGFPVVFALFMVNRLECAGIMQAKVLIQTLGDEQSQLCADIPEPEDSVEKLDELAFEPIDFQAMTMQQLRMMALENGLTGYSSLRRQQLIEKLEALAIVDEDENLEFESQYYSRVGALVS